jgi:chromate transporter
MVVEFVGFVGAFQNPGDLPPVVAGMLGAAVVTWATFAPCFLWIFLGAPYIERLRGNVRLAAALSTVTAAIVGVIANLGVSFAVATLFERVRMVELFGGPVPVPVWSSVVPFAVAVAVGAFVAMQRYRIGIVPVVAAGGLAGLLVNGLL